MRGTLLKKKTSGNGREKRMINSSVSVAKIVELLDLKNFTSDINLKKKKIITSDVNRPALQLTGYFEHFEEA